MHLGLAFPDADEFMVQELSPKGMYQESHLEAALGYVTQFGTAIDGGAHVGTWSRVMSQRFHHVLAFEPSLDTYECLQWNLQQAGVTNVECLNMALGSRRGQVSMVLDVPNTARRNTGARFAIAEGPTLQESIDSFALQDLGFLKLDVEGSEPSALEGARETLKRCHPVVLFENKKLWTRHYGLPKDAVAQILQSHGYVFRERVGCDEIWGPA